MGPRTRRWGARGWEGRSIAVVIGAVFYIELIWVRGGWWGSWSKNASLDFLWWRVGTSALRIDGALALCEVRGKRGADGRHSVEVEDLTWLLQC